MEELTVEDDAGREDLVTDGSVTGSPLQAAASMTTAVVQIARRISGSLTVSA